MNCVKRVRFDDEQVIAGTDDAENSQTQGVLYNKYFGCGKNKEKTLISYAVARYRAIQLANGEGRMWNEKTHVFEEDAPGGWSGAKAHKNENRDRPLVWIEIGRAHV